MNKDDQYYRYVYRHRLIESVRSFCTIDDAVDFWERVADTSLFQGNFEQCVAWYNQMAIEHIVDDSKLLNDPQWQLEHGYLKNSDELQAIKNLVDPIRLLVSANQIEECIFHPNWPKVVDAAQHALDIFDPYYPYTETSLPDEARQFSKNDPRAQAPMDAERWLKADLKFNNETLQQNRALLISESQIRPFQKKHNKNVRYAMIATGVVAVAIVQGLFLIGLFVDWRACLLCLPMTVIAIASGAVRWATGQGKTSAENLADLTVTETTAVVGDPDPNWGPYWQSAMLALKAEGKPLQMKIPKRYFQKGDRYRLYYIYENKKILSAEKIENGAS